MEALTYYTRPGGMTNPRSLAHLFADLPGDPASLCRIVQGLMIHVFWTERYGLTVPPARRDELQIRPVARKLARILDLDPRPLQAPRPLDRRLIANCRDFTVMLTAMLQHAGVPARARCGFGAYFEANRYIDHWVCEYWKAAQQRWVLVDAQLDALQCDALKIRFDPLDVPRDQFITGGRAWRMCRAGQADPDAFGIFELRGLWFVRGDLIRDVAALNQAELLPWDSWGLMEKAVQEMSAEDLPFLDRLADLTAGDVPEFDAVRAVYENDERLRVPPVITTYLESGPREVKLAGDLDG